MVKNYYVILGVSTDSSQNDIKAAYRRLAKEFHPDHYGKNQTPFQLIQEAYSVLSDPKSRKSYDHELSPRPGTGRPATPPSTHEYNHQEIEPLIPQTNKHHPQNTLPRSSIRPQYSIYNSTIDRLLGGFSEIHYHQVQPPDEPNIEITLTPAQAKSGGNIQLNIPFETTCPSCFFDSAFSFACWRCNGKGSIEALKQVLIYYPAGIRPGDIIKLAVTRHNQIHLHLNAIFKIRD